MLFPPLSPSLSLPLPCHSPLSPRLPSSSGLPALPTPALGLLQLATRLLMAAPGCAPDPRNHAGHLHAAEPHPGATGPRGGPAACLPPGQLLHDRGGCGPAHVSPPAGQVLTDRGLPATTAQRVGAAPVLGGEPVLLPREGPHPPSSSLFHKICGTSDNHSAQDAFTSFLSTTTPFYR